MRIFFAALMLSIPMIASAEADSGGGTVYHISKICSFDIQQYCKDISPKRIRDLKDCLSKREKDLLPRCQDHYKEAKP